jgi:hypothetical protein
VAQAMVIVGEVLNRVCDVVICLMSANAI